MAMGSLVLLLLVLTVGIEGNEAAEAMCKGELFKRQVKGSRGANPSDLLSASVESNHQKCAIQCQDTNGCLSLAYNPSSGNCQLYDKVERDLITEDAPEYTFYEKVSEFRKCDDASSLTDMAPANGVFVVDEDKTKAVLHCNSGFYQIGVNGISAAVNDSFTCENGVWTVLTLLVNKCTGIPSTMPIHEVFLAGTDNYYTSNLEQATTLGTAAGNTLEKEVFRLIGAQETCTEKKTLYQHYAEEIPDHLLSLDINPPNTAYTKMKTILGYCAEKFGQCGAIKPLHQFYNEQIQSHMYRISYKRDEHIGQYENEGTICFVW